MIELTDTSSNQYLKIRNYYRWQSKMYDATRWAFLFGREELINRVPELRPEPRILEIGCGTGKNLQLLQFLYPDAQIFGIDLSPAMLKKAEQNLGADHNITLINQAYGVEPFKHSNFDLILCSYSLTMMGQAIHTIFDHIHKDLSPKGFVAVVDFEQSPSALFRRWMLRNHVTLNGELFQYLQKYFQPVDQTSRSVYGGLWSYFMFIGQ